ncbi:MAG: hypothetical protein V7K67_09555 [Nostoc sp.]
MKKLEPLTVDYQHINLRLHAFEISAMQLMHTVAFHNRLLYVYLCQS